MGVGQPVGGPRCETRRSAHRRFQGIPRPSISTHRARPLASSQLGCARLPASLPACQQCPPACAEPCGSPGACIGGASCALPIPAGTSSCLVARLSPALASELNLAGQRLALAANVPAGLAATLTLSRTVGRSLMGCSLLEHSLPARQPASLQACQQLPARFWNTKLAELKSKARLHRARLGVGHNAPASMLALSPFSCSDNRESSVLPVTQSNSIWQCAILGLATRPDSRGGPSVRPRQRRFQNVSSPESRVHPAFPVLSWSRRIRWKHPTESFHDALPPPQ